MRDENDPVFCLESLVRFEPTATIVTTMTSGDKAPHTTIQAGMESTVNGEWVRFDDVLRLMIALKAQTEATPTRDRIRTRRDGERGLRRAALAADGGAGADDIGPGDVLADHAPGAWAAGEGKGGQMTDEEYVRANWANVWRQDQKHMHQSPSEWHGYILIDTGNEEKMIGSGARTEAWAAAAAFTRERLEQIRQLTYEISLLKLIHAQGDRSEWHPIDHEDDQDALLRSSRRLESALADLKRGMRTAAPDGARSDAND